MSTQCVRLFPSLLALQSFATGVAASAKLVFGVLICVIFVSAAIVCILVVDSVASVVAKSRYSIGESRVASCC